MLSEADDVVENSYNLCVFLRAEVETLLVSTFCFIRKQKKNESGTGKDY